MIRILLACNAGLSTTAVVEAMRTAAANKGLEVEITATTLHRALEAHETANVLLLAPQIAYEAQSAAAAVAPVPCLTIDAADYANADAERILDQALAATAEV